MITGQQLQVHPIVETISLDQSHLQLHVLGVQHGLADYGNSLGIAFQIADDFLDLWGDDNAVGKTLGTDLEQGKITLPVIRLLETASSADRHRILNVLRGPVDRRGPQIRQWLDQSDAREFTALTASEFKERAVAAIADLPPSAAKHCLTEIAEFSIQRSF